MAWVVIGPKDYDRGSVVFGPFVTRETAEAFAEEQREEDKRKLAEEYEVPADEIEDNDEGVGECEVCPLTSPEG